MDKGNLKGSLSVLIVEDEDTFRLTVREFLAADKAFEVYDCDSGESAVAFLQSNKVDVMMLDYKMPGMSGLNVLQWMHEQKDETPVLMVTAAGSEHIAVEAMKLGAYDYIRKEYLDLDHLAIIVRGIHERHLYKEEKKRRERIEIERLKSLTAIEGFHSALASVSQIVTNSLTMASANIETREMNLLNASASEIRPAMQESFAEMKQQCSVISFAIKSMLNMANTLHGNFSQEGPQQEILRMKELTEQRIQEELFSKKP